MKRIRKGDTVVITAGRDKGRTGTVIRVLPDERVLVENVNMVKKHQKPNPSRGFRTLEDGRKVRFFKSNGEVVDL